MAINYLGKPERIDATERGVHFDFSLDTASDLTAFTSDFLTENQVAKGSLAYVNTTKKAYVLDGNDSWVEV